MAQTEQTQQGSFAHQHLSMIFKYIGISFVAGAVSHGVFSGTRSLLTAGLGVVMFLIGQWIEYRQTGNSKGQLGLSLLIGAVLAIGMGFFTGSLQHFPDSPDRSLWVVPVGFAMTLVALMWMNREHLTPAVKRYAATSLVAVSAISLRAYQYFSLNPMAHDHSTHAHGEVASHSQGHAHSTTPVATQVESKTITYDHSTHSPSAQIEATHDHASHDHAAHDHAAHDHASHDHASHDHASHDHAAHDHAAHDHGSAMSAVGRPGQASQVNRVITITMDDTMRYQPSQITVKENETVRFIVENKGKIKHELTLGDAQYLQEHAAEMLKFPDMKHDEPNMVLLEAGATGEIIWQFTKAGTVDFACLQPGHFEAGMRGAVLVNKDS